METRYSVEESGEILRDVNIEIPRQAFDRKYEDFLGKTARQISIKGFRQGHVPRQVVAKRYGESIRNDVIWEFIQSTLDQVLEKSDLKVVDLEKIDVKPLVDGEDIKATATVSIFPEPLISDYRGLSLKVTEEAFSPEMVEKEILRLLESDASVVDVTDRVNLLDGDLVDISYSVSVEGEVIEDSGDETVQVKIGNLSYFPELEVALAGRKTGDEFTFTHSYPEDNENKAIAGKEGVFKVKVVDIKQQILPELTDDLIKEKTGQSSVSEYRAKIEADGRRYIAQNNESAREKAFFEEVIARNGFEVPQKMVDEEIRSILSDAFGQRDTSKVDVGLFRERFSEQATFRVKTWIIVDRLLEQEKTELSDSDWESWLLRREERFSRDREAINKLLELPEKEEHWRSIARRELVLSNAVASAQFSVTEK